MTKPSRTLRVLVVDDDPVVTDLLPVLLRAIGHTVDTARTGGLALQRLTAAPPVDAVLIDLRMPGMDGTALAKSIASLPQPPRLIGMSGSEPNAAQTLCFSGFLRKPFGIDGLVRALNSLASESSVATAAAPASPPVATTVLDTAIYQRLAACMKPAQLQQLYQRTLDYIRKTAPAFDTASLTRCCELAHTLHGSCSMVGAVELANLADDIERTVQAGPGIAPCTARNYPFSCKILNVFSPS
jgi:CheY-like chemotaxis protein/HPt (histidine-containing phosphotransfer) domain-containing protein